MIITDFLSHGQGRLQRSTIFLSPSGSCSQYCARLGNALRCLPAWHSDALNDKGKYLSDHGRVGVVCDA